MQPEPREDAPGLAPGFAVALAAIAGITYSTFLLEHFLSPDLDVINGYVSELSAVDQPFHQIYSAGDFVTGVLSIVVAVTCLLTLRRRPWSALGWSFLGLFGVCAIGDAVFPLDCAPSLETWCALRERSENVSFSHQFHAVTSSMVIVFGVSALLTLSIAARRYGWWPVLARWGWRLAVAETAFALSTVLAMLLGQWLGIIQRVQISVLVLGLFTIAWALHDDRRRARRDAPHDRSDHERTPL
ncbi:DUF998 domain-containing protein [Spirillospora sp. NPDC047279]|uniref:DUF998 domain-containing protein n=1 Tax=Spirillospora sp. NPDC047279 TaxID=3155478 RepID=UPI0033C89AA9